MQPTDSPNPSAAGAAGQPLPDIRRTVTLNAPIDRAWKAVSTAEGMAAWFMPSSLEPVVGHEFILEAGPFGKSPCRVTEAEPPNRLSFRWGKDWQLTFELRELDAARTEFTVIHSGWSEGQVTEFGQPHTVIRENMAGGWSGIVAKLARSFEA